jgi:hypothetical protein
MSAPSRPEVWPRDPLHAEVTAEQDPFAALQARTLLQHSMVEQERMVAARVAFEGEGGSNGRDSESASSGGDREGGSGDWGDSDG